MTCLFRPHAYTLRERREHDGIPGVMGFACACGAWVPALQREKAEHLRVKREGRVKQSKARTADVVPLRRRA